MDRLPEIDKREILEAVRLSRMYWTRYRTYDSWRRNHECHLCVYTARLVESQFGMRKKGINTGLCSFCPATYHDIFLCETISKMNESNFPEIKASVLEAMDRLERAIENDDTGNYPVFLENMRVLHKVSIPL